MNGKGGIRVHFDYLRAFCVVVRAKSITKAAKELHLSQPALSQQINSLENKFRTKLLERSNRGVTVTSPARKIPIWNAHASIMEALEQEIRNIQEPGSRRVSIAASPIPAPSHAHKDVTYIRPPQAQGSW